MDDSFFGGLMPLIREDFTASLQQLLLLSSNITASFGVEGMEDSVSAAALDWTVLAKTTTSGCMMLLGLDLLQFLKHHKIELAKGTTAEKNKIECDKALEDNSNDYWAKESVARPQLVDFRSYNDNNEAASPFVFSEEDDNDVPANRLPPLDSLVDNHDPATRLGKNDYDNNVNRISFTQVLANQASN